MRIPANSGFHTHWALSKKTVFLNHGSFGACPKEVLKVQQELRKQMEASPVQFLWRHFDGLLDISRNALAEFVKARPQDLVFTSNATSGVNAVLQSLKLRSGDALLTTDHAYNACQNVVFEAARRTGATVNVARVPFPLTNSNQILEAVLQKVTSRTRVAMIDHVSSHTALIFPIEKIVRALESKGIETLVDGAHAPGMVPLDLNRLRPAFYTGNLHKWVCAPKGAGFLWVREDRQNAINAPVISHGYNTPRSGYTPFQDRFDWTGTFDPTAWFSVPAAIEFIKNLLPGGFAELRRRNHAIAVQARRRLCEKLQVPAPCPESMLGAMATLALPAKFQGISKTARIDPEQIRLHDEFGIEVPLLRLGNPEKRWFRISAQIYNSMAQYDYLARALLTAF